MSKKEAESASQKADEELDRLMFHFDGIADMEAAALALYCVVDPRKSTSR